MMRGTCLIQNGPLAAVQLLAILGEDAPDLEAALLAVQRIGREAHVATDGDDELRNRHYMYTCTGIG